MDETVYVWRIQVNGYGEFQFVGTEREAEERRKAKAKWEGAVATKEIVRTYGATEIP